MSKTSIQTSKTKREQILEFLKAREVKISPVSYEDIARATGLQSLSVVKYHLDMLEETGKIERIGTRQIKVKE